MGKNTYNESMDNAKIIGDRIKKARQDIHLTQEDVAKMLDIGRAAYSNIENGYSTVSVAHLTNLEAILGKSVSYFLHGLPTIRNLRTPEKDDNSISIQDDILAAISALISRLPANDQLEILMYIQYRFGQVDQIDHLRKAVDVSTQADLRETLDELLAGISRDLARRHPNN